MASLHIEFANPARRLGRLGPVLVQVHLRDPPLSVERDSFEAFSRLAQSADVPRAYFVAICNPYKPPDAARRSDLARFCGHLTNLVGMSVVCPHVTTEQAMVARGVATGLRMLTRAGEPFHFSRNAWEGARWLAQRVGGEVSPETLIASIAELGCGKPHHDHSDDASYEWGSSSS